MLLFVTPAGSLDTVLKQFPTPLIIMASSGGLESDNLYSGELISASNPVLVMTLHYCWPHMHAHHPQH